MTGQAGSRNRRDEETLAVLAGQTKDKRRSAVRHDEIGTLIDAAVAKAVASISRSEGSLSRIETFRYPSKPPAPGAHSWKMGDTEWPPAGGGGGALWIPRNSAGAGSWLAMTAAGGSGDTNPRAFISTTSSDPSNWGRWREIYHQGSILGPVGFEAGEPNGGLIHAIGDANGWVQMFASGLMIAEERLQPLTFNTADVLRREWTFRVPFIAPPGVYPSIPAVSGGSHVDVDPVGIGHAFVSVPDGDSAMVALRRSYGAPAFVSTSSVAGMRAVAVGAWGVPDG